MKEILKFLLILNTLYFHSDLFVYAIYLCPLRHIVFWPAYWWKGYYTNRKRQLYQYTQSSYFCFFVSCVYVLFFKFLGIYDLDEVMFLIYVSWYLYFVKHNNRISQGFVNSILYLLTFWWKR